MRNSYNCKYLTFSNTKNISPYTTTDQDLKNETVNIIDLVPALMCLHQKEDTDKQMTATHCDWVSLGYLESTSKSKKGRVEESNV